MITKIKTKEIKKAKARKPKRKIYSNRIQAILTEIGMSQQELADKVGVDSAHLSRIMNGQRQCISLPIAIEVSMALERPVEEVFQITKDGKLKAK